MSDRAEAVFNTIQDQINKAVTSLSDSDFLDVLESIVDDCEVQIDAKKREDNE